MKKSFLGLFLFFSLLAITWTNQSTHAQGTQPAAAGDAVKFIEITIRGLKVWPIKPSGRCWDPPCFFQKYDKKLPPRGNPNYDLYFNNPYFKKLCEKPIAPDPLVEINIGQYEKFTTDKINNSCNPVFNIKHTFRITPNDAFRVSVYDNDGAAKVQVKRDHMGTWSAERVPNELMQGGTLTLRGFGQIEELVLTARVVERKVSNGCEGVYKVRIAEYAVKPTKESGKTWDRGIGKATRPDVVVRLKIGDTVLNTPVRDNTLAARFSSVQKVFTLKKGTAAHLTVLDMDLFNRSEVIGETAVTDVCTLISPTGIYTFTGFGQVEKVVLIFEKQQ